MFESVVALRHDCCAAAAMWPHATLAEGESVALTLREGWFEVIEQALAGGNATLANGDTNSKRLGNNGPRVLL